MTDEIPQEWIDVAVDAFNRDQRSGASTVGGMVYAALAAVFPLIEQRVNEIEAIVGRTVNDE